MRSAVKALLLGTVFGTAALACSAQAAQFVTNGGFETLSSGYGQLAYNTNATGWSLPAPNGSYAFVFNDTNVSTGVNGQYGSLALWTSSNGGTTAIPASPDGGNFVAIDSAFQVGALTQTITGLVVGQTYTLDFYWAAAQQKGFDGATFDSLTVSLGSESYTTSTINLVNHGFSGWEAVQFTYTATSATEVLSFLAAGGPPGVPPFALLDGVSLTGPSSAPTPVPEPATMALLGAGLLGLAGAAVRRRRG